MRKTLFLSLLFAFYAARTFGQETNPMQHFAEEALEEKIRTKAPKPDEHTHKALGDNLETGVGAEPFISLSKFNPDLLSISYMDDQALTWRINISTDGGQTWNLSAFNSRSILAANYPDNVILGGGDPVAVFDSNGKLHVTFIHLHSTPANVNNQNAYIFELFYATSVDTGQTWQSENSIADGTFGSFDFVDRQWMDIDLNNNIYLAGVHFSASAIGAAGIIMWKKNSNQPNFTPLGVTAIPQAGSTPQFSNLTVDEDSMVHITASRVAGQGGTSNDQITYVSSNPGASTFGGVTTLGNANTFPSNNTVHDRENGAVSSAVDGQNVYVAWTDFDGTVKSYYVYSHDGGATFSNPIEIAASNSSSSYALMPVVAADNGNFAISWYQVDSAALTSDYVVANSIDQGVTLENPIVVSDQLTNFTNAGNAFYGDYNSATMRDQNLHLSWCDGRSGNPRVYYACIDFSTITSVAEVTPLHDALQLKNLFPNPIQNTVQLDVYVAADKKVKVDVLDESGRLCHSKEFSGIQGTNRIALDLNQLRAGNYLIRLTSQDNYTVTRKVLKL